jgi:hypothetical protein
VSENTVAAMMRELHLAARRAKKRKNTTRPAKGRWRTPDLVKRDFPASQLNRKWYGDGTEIPTGEGKLYLASVLDMASRRVVGFALSEHHDAQLAYGALAMAVTVRGGQVPGVVFHTDQGRIHRWAGPLGVRAAGYPPVHGPARFRARRPGRIADRPVQDRADPPTRALARPPSRSNWPPLNTSTGSTTGACMKPAATSRPQNSRTPNYRHNNRLTEAALSKT